MSAPIMEIVQLCFGLKASDKNPKTTLAIDVEDTVKRITKWGTYTIGCNEKVFDTYERIADAPKLRAFIDFDVKKYNDGTEISKFQGIVLREQLREVFAKIIPELERTYGSVVLGDSSGMKTPVGLYTVSFRLWFPNVVGSKLAIKQFAERIVAEFVMPNVGHIGDGKIDWVKFFDVSVYKSIVKLRLPGCTKQGETYRPLLIDHELSSKDVAYSDVLVTYMNPKYVVHALVEPDVTTTATDTSSKISAKLLTSDIIELTIEPNLTRLTDSQFKLMCAVADACSMADWDDHNTRFLFISALWNAEASDRMRDFIHKQCELKNAKNDPKCVEREIRNAHKYGMTANVLLKHAWEYDRVGVAKLKSTFLYSWDSLFRRQEEIDAIQEIMRTKLIDAAWKQDVYSERFVRPYMLDEYDTIAVRSHMGTGKTVQLTGLKARGIPATAVRERFPRVLILSARRAYTAFIVGELAREGLTYYTNYMDVKGDLAGIGHLVLQMESLHRIAEGFISYDLVIMDEAESLLAQMNSVGTHAANHRLNYETLEKVVHTAGKVLAMDAFLTSRSLNFLESLRPGRSALYVRNKYQPYARKATEHVILSEKQILPNISAMHAQLLEHAVGGKRIVYVCSSKEKGYEMEHVLVEKGIAVIFHCGDDTKDKKSMLLNVREEWAKHQVVIYTSTITVGVSYSDILPEHEFDE
jgi:hypothetical protein